MSFKGEICDIVGIKRVSVFTSNELLKIYSYMDGFDSELLKSAWNWDSLNESQRMDMIVEELENWIQEAGYPLVFNRHRKVGESSDPKWIRARVDIKGMNRWAQLALLNLLEETKLVEDACNKKHGWGLRELQTLLNKPVKPTKVKRYASAPLSNDELANMLQ